jgi:glyoxylase-like metal-dependent hydrolase (beta-lactamase superfamily II)
MAVPAVIVEALPAGYGDCLLVTCKLRRGVWRMLVDTGPYECWPKLKARLAELPANGGGKRHIDLAVITHIDHDHIGGASALFGDRELGLKFGDIWFNAPRGLASRGVAEGQSLATLLGAPETALPWNAAWGGRHAVTPNEAGFVQLPGEDCRPKLTLLSPRYARRSSNCRSL